MMAYTGRLRPKAVPFLAILSRSVSGGKRPGSTPNDGLYGKAPPERGAFFSLQPYKRVGIILDEEYERVKKSVISVFKGIY